jgi:hypothetical protein
MCRILKGGRYQANLKLDYSLNKDYVESQLDK